jgi:hypothetical protein
VFAKLDRTSFQRGAGCGHVIDQSDLFSTDHRAIIAQKRIFHIVFSLDAVKVGLGGRLADPPQRSLRYSHVDLASQRLGQQERLVVASGALSLWVQGHWDQNVCLKRQMSPRIGHTPAERGGQAHGASVLEGMDEPSDGFLVQER